MNLTAKPFLEWIAGHAGVLLYAGTLVLSGLVSLVLATILGDKVAIFFARYLGGFTTKPRRQLSGVWYSVFWFRNVDGKLESRQNLVCIKALGDKFVAETVAGDDHAIRFYGSTSADTYSTGRWEHKTVDNLYHGSFQFMLEPEGDGLHGRWIGFNKRQGIATGPWTLVKLERKTNKKTILGLKNGCSVNGKVKLHLAPTGTLLRLSDLIELQKKHETTVRWFEIGTDGLMPGTPTASGA